MSEEVEKSFHVTCLPGRPLMWKRQPTKRDFVFHLSKLDKSTKIFTDDESVLSTGNKTMSVKNIINDTNENLRPGKENLSGMLNTMEKTGNPYVTKSNKRGLTTQMSALKDVGNIQGFPTLNPCKNFETPLLSVAPAVRRLVDVFVPSDQESVQSTTSQSTKVSVKELSNLSYTDLSRMIALHTSHPSILKNTVCSTIVDNEKTVSMMNVTDTGDVLKITSEEDTKLESELDKNETRHLLDAQVGSGSKDSGFRSDNISSDLERSGSDVIEQEKSIRKNLSQMKDDEVKVSSSEAAADEPASHVIESFSDQNKSKGNSLNISTEQNEGIVNASTCKRLSQLKEQSEIMDDSDTQHSLVSEDAISDTRDKSTAAILLLSPIHSKNENLASNGSTQICNEKDLTCDVLKKKDGQENYVKTNALRQAGRSSDAATAKSKRSSIRRRIDFKMKSTGLIVHQATALSPARANESYSPSSTDSRKRYYLSQDIVKNLKRRKIKQNLSLTVLPENKPNFILAPRVKKYAKKRKECGPISGNIPSKVKVLMYRKASIKRKMNDITDLEVIINFLISDDSEGVPKISVEAEKIFNSYRRGVVKDMIRLVSTSVELQAKMKQISKLYGEIQRKGKKLGALIDEQHKIRHGIANGEFCIAE